MQRRTIILLSCIAVTLALIVVTLLAVPYKTETVFINRRTARTTVITTYFMIPMFVERGEQSVLEKLGLPLTAPDINLELDGVSRRYPWSSGDGGGPYPGRRILYCYNLMFDTPYAHQDEAHQDQFETLMHKRLELWNSPKLESIGPEQTKEFRDRNSLLFPGSRVPSE